MSIEISNNKKMNEELNIEDIVEIKPVQTDKKTDKKTDEEIDNCVFTSPSSTKKLCLEKGIDFCKIVNQHCCLLTNDFCKTNVPKCCKSKWVGYTSFLYISPYFFVPGSGGKIFLVAAASRYLPFFVLSIFISPVVTCSIVLPSLDLFISIVWSLIGKSTSLI